MGVASDASNGSDLGPLGGDSLQGTGVNVYVRDAGLRFGKWTASSATTDTSSSREGFGASSAKLTPRAETSAHRWRSRDRPCLLGTMAGRSASARHPAPSTLRSHCPP